MGEGLPAVADPNENGFGAELAVVGRFAAPPKDDPKEKGAAWVFESAAGGMLAPNENEGVELKPPEVEPNPPNVGALEAPLLFASEEPKPPLLPPKPKDVLLAKGFEAGNGTLNAEPAGRAFFFFNDAILLFPPSVESLERN